MKKILWLLAAFLFASSFSSDKLVQSLHAQTEQQSVVQAVLFYSPTCPHCHTVIDQHLPPLQQQYGDRLQILGVDVSKPVGQQLYQNTIGHFNLSSQRQGVPALVVGDTVLVGSVEIPQMFPQIIADGLAAGGIGWPDIPALFEIVPDLPPSAAPGAALPAAEPPAAESAAEGVGVGLAEIDTATLAAEAAPLANPSGFALAWLVMGGMALALVYAFWRFQQARLAGASFWETAVAPLDTPFIPLLLLVGLVVAAYLSYVEVTHVEAVCGPVGECNLVQSSPYAQIFGIPIAVLGLVNYLAVGGLWLWQRANPLQKRPVVALLVLTIFGVFFSIYLTALELLVIHAICAWCLTSAVVTTLLMVVVVNGVTQRPSALASELVG